MGCGASSSATPLHDDGKGGAIPAAVKGDGAATTDDKKKGEAAASPKAGQHGASKGGAEAHKATAGGGKDAHAKSKDSSVLSHAASSTVSTLPAAPAAHGTGTAQRGESHSSKLDLPALGGPRDADAERGDIMNKVLCCRNCEDPAVPLAVWCAECAREGDGMPPVLCEACNIELHQFAKTRAHVRESARSMHTGRMKSAHELGLPGALLPAGLPALETLACSNCDSDVTVFCAQCKTLLCQSCARDIHQPKLLRAHNRHAVTCRFILSASVGPKDKTNHKTDEAGETKDRKVSVVSTPKNAPAASPKAANGTAKAATPRAAAGTTNSVPVAQTFMPTSSPAPATVKHTKLKSRLKTTETHDIVPTENPGLSGDVFVFADPNLKGELANVDQLEYRNLHNPYDTIGSVQIVSISCGADHAGAVTALGSLFMWGSNVESQLGCGVALGAERWTKEPILIEFPRHTPVRQVACGAVHTLALCQDSSMYAWGEGKMGKLGLTSDDDRDVPTLVQLGHWGPRGDDEKEDMSGVEEVTFIACGQNNSGCVVRGRKDKFQLYLWGEGANGQIPAAPHETNAALIPKLFPSLAVLHVPEQKSDPYPQLAQLAFGTKHVAVATVAGSVFTWGDNSFGQLGYTLASNDGDNLALQLTPRLVPKLYLDGVKCKQLCCGERHTTVLSTTGDVWSFGSGESHQIGIMDNVDQFLPQKAVGLGPAANNPIQSVCVGASISAAVNEAGETWMWGYGVESPCPALVEGLRGKIAQRCAIGANANVAVLTGSSKELYEWQFDGQPLDAEEQHGTAAGEGGDAAAHDANGDETQPHTGGGKGTPAVNASLRGKKLVAMSAGKNHYMVVTADGKMYGYGSNYLHECGLRLPGEITYVPHPLEVKVATMIVDVKCAVEHTISLDAQGRVWTHGVGFEGRLGHVSNADVAEPKLVQTLVDAKVQVRSTAIGPSNCGIVSTEGEVWLCGAGNGGQLGNDDFLPVFKPTLLKHLSQSKEKVRQLAIGNYHMCAVTEKGEVFTWGDNKFGQLGLAPGFEEEHAAYPQSVLALTALGVKVSQVECGDNVCLALTAAGELYGWGTGETMQLCRKARPEGGEDTNDGFGSSGEDVPSPVKLLFPFQRPGAFTKIKNFSVRDINCVALTESGEVWSWGWDLGEYPEQLHVRKPSMGAAAAAASASAPPGAAKPTEEVKFERVTLGHTRMMLMT